MNLDGKGKVAAPHQVASASTTTALGTSAGAVNGLTIPVKSGFTYVFRCSIYTVPVGSPTATGFNLTGPSATAITINKFYSTAAAIAQVQTTAFGDAAATTQTATISAVMFGRFTASADGNLVVSGIRTGGTSQTVQAGSFLEVIRL